MSKDNMAALVGDDEAKAYMVSANLRSAHVHVSMAFADLLRVVFATFPDERIAELRELCKHGGRVAIGATLHEGNAHVELSVTEARDAIFEKALLKFDGPAEVMFAEPGDMQVVDRNKLQ